MLEINFSLIENECGLIGMSFVAQPQTQAELFCELFPVGLLKKTGADITVEDDKIILKDPIRGTCVFEITLKDAKAIRQLLTLKLGLHHDGMLTPGFKIVLNGREKEGKKRLIASRSIS